MRVLLLRANPRKTGYAQRLGDLFLQGVRETDAIVKDVDLTELSMERCLGCYHCWLTTPGQCVHSDDMGPLLKEVLAADVVVCLTPLYFYSMSAALKIFFERTLPLTRQGFVPSAGGGTRNSTRYPDRWQGKRLISIVTGALRDPSIYQPLNDTFRLLADGLDLDLAGQLTRPESYLLDYPLSKPRTLKKIRVAFVQAGRETGTAGRLSRETMENASLPLSVDCDHFRTYSNIYWARAVEMGEAGLVPFEVQKNVAADVRILMREMIRSLDPVATARVKATLQFEFPDQKLAYQLRIDLGQCKLTEGQAENPDLRIRCNSEVWAALFTRQLDIRKALAERTLVLEGDKSLFSRLDRFFPPPSS